MTRSAHWLGLALACFVLTAPVQGQELVAEGGNTSEVNGCWLQSGGLYVAVGKPGLMFGMLRLPNGERQFTYLVLFKHRAANESQIGKTGQLATDGGQTVHVRAVHEVVIDGRRLAVGSDMQVNLTRNAVVKDELTMNGKKMSRVEGRLILADFTGDKLTYKQVQASLPGKLPSPTDTEGLQELVKRVLAELPAESKEVRTFLK